MDLAIWSNAHIKDGDRNISKRITRSIALGNFRNTLPELCIDSLKTNQDLTWLDGQNQIHITGNTQGDTHYSLH